MSKVKVKFLDIPIIRSCNLNCAGCLTFSDGKKIKGLVKLDESIEWLEHWSKKLDPTIVTVFGGEPLLHPQFVEWYKAIKHYFPDSTPRINTNGYYLHTLFDKIGDFFTEELQPRFIVSIQTEAEPYQTIVRNNIAELKQRVLDHYAAKYPNETVTWNLWLDEPEWLKKWWCIDIGGRNTGIWIVECTQYNQYWQDHYEGEMENIRPFYKWDDVHAATNHAACQAAPFVNLYKGKIYKCPTVAVLEHTLDTYGLMEEPEWDDYLKKYKHLDMNSTDEEIAQWFETQKSPENICNMCGFTGPKSRGGGHKNGHEPKEGWKLKQIPIIPV